MKLHFLDHPSAEGRIVVKAMEADVGTVIVLDDVRHVFVNEVADKDRSLKSIEIELEGRSGLLGFFGEAEEVARLLNHLTENCPGIVLDAPATV